MYVCCTRTPGSTSGVTSFSPLTLWLNACGTTCRPTGSNDLLSKSCWRHTSHYVLTVVALPVLSSLFFPLAVGRNTRSLDPPADSLPEASGQAAEAGAFPEAILQVPESSLRGRTSALDGFICCRTLQEKASGFVG